jgi:hypothetical protein
LKRHLRSCAVSQRATRDADRALAAAAVNAALVSSMRRNILVDPPVRWRPSRLTFPDIVFLDRLSVGGQDGTTPPWRLA